MADGDRRMEQPRSRMLDSSSYLLPIAFAFTVHGSAGWYGCGDIVTLVVMALSAICLQVTSNLARSLGDLVDAERARKEYYERKFARFKLESGRLDPITGTAGDLLMMRMRTMLLTSCAVTLVMGYGLVVLCLGTAVLGARWLAFSAIVALVALALLRFLGRWRFAYRPYGNVIVFALATGAALGSTCLLTHAFVLGALYPAAAFGALAAAAGNMADICNMEDDNEYSLHENPRRTLPLAASVNAGFAFHAVMGILAIIWLAVLPIWLGARGAWDYAFLVFAIPLVLDMVAIRRSQRSELGRYRTSLAVSTLCLCAAFFLGSVIAHVGAAFFAF